MHSINSQFLLFFFFKIPCMMILQTAFWFIYKELASNVDNLNRIHQICNIIMQPNQDFSQIFKCIIPFLLAFTTARRRSRKVKCDQASSCSEAHITGTHISMKNTPLLYISRVSEFILVRSNLIEPDSLPDWNMSWPEIDPHTVYISHLLTSCNLSTNDGKKN